MSVIIKGLNKFYSCRLCPFNNSDYYCNITKGNIDRDDYSCEGECPIVQLPKGHGGLIEQPTDADIAETIGGQNDFADCIRGERMTNKEAKKIIFNQWQAFLDNYIDYAGVSEAYELAIKALEQDKWIPVNKQLPIKSDYYLATIKESSGEQVVRSVWYDGEWKFMSVVQNVIAWMPLPELYKEESDVTV